MTDEDEDFDVEKWRSEMQRTINTLTWLVIPTLVLVIVVLAWQGQWFLLPTDVFALGMVVFARWGVPRLKRLLDEQEG